jgi:hypothetical protein
VSQPLPSYQGTSNATGPAPAPLDTSGEPVPVFLTSAVRTSAGPGPGVKLLPPAEAAGLVARRLAVAGDRPPRGFPG